MITIAITDDHPLVINGVKDMLSSCSDISISGEYLNGQSLLHGLAKQLLPDILLLDINLPDIRGEELTLIINKKHPTVKILALSNFDSTLYASNMVHNGASGYLLKNTDKETLITAIKAVYAGATYFSDDIKERVASFNKKRSKKSGIKASLTPREIEILKLLTKGYSNQQIAIELFLSKRTVENYRLNLSIKLDVKNTAALVKYAIELGLGEQ